MNQIFTNIFSKTHRSGNVTWIVRWKDPKTGRWIKRSAGRTEDEAKLLEAEVRRELALGHDPTPQEPLKIKQHTVEEVVALFLQSAKFLTAKPHWQSETKRRLSKDLIPRLGKLKFHQLKKETVLKFYLALKERGLSHASIQKYHALVSSLGDVYTEVEGQGDNPIRKIRDFKKYFPDQPSTREINFLTPEELECLFEAAKQSHCSYSTPLSNSSLLQGLEEAKH